MHILCFICVCAIIKYQYMLVDRAYIGSMKIAIVAGRLSGSPITGEAGQGLGFRRPYGFL